jgi:hypothetical protein
MLLLISKFHKSGRTTVGLVATIPTSAYTKAQND